MNGQIFYRLSACLVLLAALAACDARPGSQIDRRGLLDSLLKDGPKVEGVSQALLSTATQAEESRNYGRALQYYKQLIDKYPEDISYKVKYADNLRRMQKNEEAIAAYDSVLRLKPRNVSALEGRGLAYINKGDFSSASASLQKVMKIDNKRWRTLNGVGLLFVAKKMPDEAVAYFNSALKHSSNHPTVLNNIGLNHALQAEYPQALDALNRASSKVKSKSGERQHIEMNLALVLGLSGDMDKAEQIAGRHLQDSALQNNLGFYAHLADDDKLAKAYLNSALSGSSTFYDRAWQNLENIN